MKYYEEVSEQELIVLFETKYDLEDRLFNGVNVIDALNIIDERIKKIYVVPTAK